MPKSIEFYFDFSSPYGYLASTRIEALAARHNRAVNWHPILLGFIYKVTESRPLIDFPLKGKYSLRDMQRSAREHNIPFRIPTRFPLGTVAAARACLWEATRDTQRATALIHALYKAYFVDDVDLSDLDAVVTTAESLGIDGSELRAALAEDSVKTLLKQNIDAALEKGVFGSPFLLVDDEPFWGNDRLNDVDRWLSTGGW